MDRGLIGTRMEPNMKETSKPANATATESTNMQTAQSTRVIGSMVNAKAMASSLGRTASANMMVSGQTMCVRVKAL